MATRNEEPEKAYHTIDSNRFNPSETSPEGLYWICESDVFFSNGLFFACCSTPVLELLRSSYIDFQIGPRTREIIT